MNSDKPVKVAELKPGEAGRGVARVDPALMDILGSRFSLQNTELVDINHMRRR